MINLFKNFSKKKIGGLLLILVIVIAFGFGGFGGGFNTGNQNNIAKINNTNISTQDFMSYLNKSGVAREAIQKNLDQNIIEELLSGLISANILDLEINDFNITITEKTLLKKIKQNKSFLDENNTFQRTKYEKFLLTNNMSAPMFELRLKNRELQKQLFDYIGSGSVSPKFLVEKLYEEENKKLELSYLSLESFYKKKNTFTDQDLEKFISENKEKFNRDYIDFSYAIINPKNLIGLDDFNETFFSKIDKIEDDISKGVDFQSIISNLGIKTENIKNYTKSSEVKNIENSIFELRDNKIDIFENKNNYILFNIEKNLNRKPNLINTEIKNEIIELVYQKNKYEFNKNIFEKIQNKIFNNDEFLKMSENLLQNTTLTSIGDNNKFEINSVKALYSLPKNSFTLIGDDKDNVFVAKIINFNKEYIKDDDKKYKKFQKKQKLNNKNSILKSYDFFLNNKYKVVLNQKTIERVKNYFR